VEQLLRQRAEVMEKENPAGIKSRRPRPFPQEHQSSTNAELRYTRRIRPAPVRSFRFQEARDVSGGVAETGQRWARETILSWDFASQIREYNSLPLRPSQFWGAALGD
jgi:hypothetical protein